MDEHAWLAERFEEHRTRLRAVANRMLGSLAEANEAVQDAWLGVSGLGAGEIDNLSGQNPACLSPNVSSASTFSSRPVKNSSAPPVSIEVPPIKRGE
jgi:Sigma-70 region 2